MNKTQVCGYRANNQNPNARRKGNSGRPPGYWPLILAFLAAIEPVKQGFAGTPHPRSVNGSVRITLRLYSYAQVPSEILQRAEDDVVKVFRPAGVYVNFVDCPLTDELGPSYPACRGAASPSDFIMNIVTPGMATHLPASSDSFGLAVTCGPHEKSCVAYVFYERARQLAPSAKVGPSVVLGRVLSHELGHLLGLAHSESGLMRAEWNPDDFDPGSLPGMVFTSGECQQIHAEAAARPNAVGRSRLGRTQELSIGAHSRLGPLPELKRRWQVQIDPTSAGQ